MAATTRTKSFSRRIPMPKVRRRRFTFRGCITPLGAGRHAACVRTADRRRPRLRRRNHDRKSARRAYGALATCDAPSVVALRRRGGRGRRRIVDDDGETARGGAAGQQRVAPLPSPVRRTRTKPLPPAAAGFQPYGTATAVSAAAAKSGSYASLARLHQIGDRMRACGEAESMSSYVSPGDRWAARSVGVVSDAFEGSVEARTPTNTTRCPRVFGHEVDFVPVGVGFAAEVGGRNEDRPCARGLAGEPLFEPVGRAATALAIVESSRTQNYGVRLAASNCHPTTKAIAAATSISRRLKPRCAPTRAPVPG